MALELVIYGAITTALFFDFVNAFPDSASSISTIVGTRVLRPLPMIFGVRQFRKRKVVQ